jgi:hypothetical protein
MAIGEMRLGDTMLNDKRSSYCRVERSRDISDYSALDEDQRFLHCGQNDSKGN